MGKLEDLPFWRQRKTASHLLDLIPDSRVPEVLAQLREIRRVEQARIEALPESERPPKNPDREIASWAALNRARRLPGVKTVVVTGHRVAKITLRNGSTETIDFDSPQQAAWAALQWNLLAEGDLGEMFRAWDRANQA